MLKLVILQVIIILVLSSVAYSLIGVNDAYSLILGGLCYIIPTSLMVLFLRFLRPYLALAGAGFLISESLKIVLAVVLMVGVVTYYPALQFLPFIFGLFAASHIVFLLFLKVFCYGK